MASDAAGGRSGRKSRFLTASPLSALRSRMFDRLLMISLLVVGLGLIYLCGRATATVVLLSTRGAVLLWRLARCRRVCPDCRRLGERCPWCTDDLHRLS